MTQRVNNEKFSDKNMFVTLLHIVKFEKKYFHYKAKFYLYDRICKNK